MCPDDYHFLFTDADTLDIRDKEAVRAFVREHGVRYILNCAAYTAVDKAETDEAACTHINRDAVRNLGEVAREAGARVFHVSTDYVFDGTQCRPYVESDPTCPVSVYGRTKLAGEQALMEVGRTKLAGEQALMEVCPDSVIIRTAWLYSEYGHNFMKTVLKLGREREELRFIFDQVGTPTYAGDLASAMLNLLTQAEEGRFAPGIYHFSNEGVCSWYDFTIAILRLAGIRTRVVPIETEDYPTPAHRPHYSVLNKGKIKRVYGLEIPHWESSLAACMNHYREQEG